jgi:hypothetical protein
MGSPLVTGRIMDAIEELRQLEERLEKRLKLNRDYIALQAVRRALREVMSATEPPPAPRLRPPPLPPRARPQTFAGGGMPLDVGPSQADAAFEILAETNEPSPVGPLVNMVRGRGATVGGTNPELNLSSSLSRDGRFRSVRFNGRPCWWLKDRPYLGEIDFGARPETKSAEEPAKASSADILS